jgi:hypothetical protein
MFSASVSLRIHAVMTTTSGFTPASFSLTAFASSKINADLFDAFEFRGVDGARFRERPILDRESCLGTVCPMMPVTPTTSARPGDDVDIENLSLVCSLRINDIEKLFIPRAKVAIQA